MKKLKKPELSSRSGVALIMVLGLLSILTLLAIAFAIAMRVERIAARNYANGVRAKHLVEAALVRAIDHVGESMAGEVYPCWNEEEPLDVFDALPSYDPSSPDKCTDLITGEALANVPFSLRADISNATDYVHWKDVISKGGETNGPGGDKNA